MLGSVPESPHINTLDVKTRNRKREVQNVYTSHTAHICLQKIKRIKALYFSRLLQALCELLQNT